ncbi:hypothetical protein [Solimicrobium silvestre]|uniref:Uncharacterized protein n=1 Tax=Solimicrobium silvestre TaxID=2099400 RepID=A0A2S9GSI2_9BURK|nr:hypothetical protein [Solimicrobium silvestre]PRC90671.1 hypothetical protein S2091_4621 [Solimicrobium silvestre]
MKTTTYIFFIAFSIATFSSAMAAQDQLLLDQIHKKHDQHMTSSQAIDSAKMAQPLDHEPHAVSTPPVNEQRGLRVQPTDMNTPAKAIEPSK